MQENPAKVPEERQADYREMYLVMARAMEKCVRELIEAQRHCEELYLRSTEEYAPVPRQLRRAWGSVGAGRRPRPLSGVDGACRRIVGADLCVGP